MSNTEDVVVLADDPPVIAPSVTTKQIIWVEPLSPRGKEQEQEQEEDKNKKRKVTEETKDDTETKKKPKRQQETGIQHARRIYRDAHSAYQELVDIVPRAQKIKDALSDARINLAAAEDEVRKHADEDHSDSDSDEEEKKDKDDPEDGSPTERAARCGVLMNRADSYLDEALLVLANVTDACTEARDLIGNPRRTQCVHGADMEDDCDECGL